MKIFSVSNGFTGTTLPLLNALSKKGNHVDAYYFVEPFSSEIESLNYEKIGFYKIFKVPFENRVYKYLPKTVSIFLVPIPRIIGRLENWHLGYPIRAIRTCQAHRLAKIIAMNHYDAGNVVVHNDADKAVLDKLNELSIPVTITHHEVLNSLNGVKTLKPVIAQTLLMSNEVIIHSEKTKTDIIEMMPTIDKKKLHTIYFGPFESFSSYLGELLPNPYGDYFLYIGYLKPYKGVKYLYEAVKRMGNLRKYNFVVAGNGFDEYVEKMKLDDDFIVINRYIHNYELVSLISQAKAIVCPYTNTSQSGLPQTSMQFNIPVIASNIGAFPEVIENGRNGILVEACNVEELVYAFLKIQSGYVLKTDRIPEKLNWNYIADQHMKLYSIISQHE